MTLGAVYRTTDEPHRSDACWRLASGVVLAPVGLADIQPGDAILIIGKTAEGALKGAWSAAAVN